MGAFVPAIVTAWGIAWLVGFGAFWLIDGLAPGFRLPLAVAAATFAVLIAAALVLSALLGIRAGRGIRTTTACRFQGSVYGATWWIGGLGIAVLGWGLSVNGMSPELASFYYSSGYVLFTGLMFLVAGVIWHAVPSVVLGVWTVAVAAVAPFFGYPGNFLFLALAGGGAFLVLAVVARHYLRRGRDAVGGAGRG